METLARRRLQKFLQIAQTHAVLRRQITGSRAQSAWTADLFWVATRSKMAKINFETRKKREPTDVLSFPAPLFFQQQGVLGELVICSPVLRAQAREQGHSDRIELDVLLVHGILHLLGLDHELGSADARVMARWERRLLKEGGLREQDLRRALIDRASE